MSAIIVEHLAKQFSVYHHQRPTTFVEAFKQRMRHMRPHETFWALRDVTFNVEPGQMVGLIGANGAGKSTFCELLGGVGRPDRVASMLQGGSAPSLIWAQVFIRTSPDAKMSM